MRYVNNPEIESSPLCSSASFNTLGFLKALLEATDSRNRQMELFRIVLMTRDLGVDKLHSKQLVVDEFQKGLDFIGGQLYG